MGVLTASIRTIPSVQITPDHGYIVDFQVKADAVIFQGALLGDDGSGFARPLVALDPFFGLALEDKTGGSSDGDVTVRTLCGSLVKFTSVTGTTVADIGLGLYATNDNPEDTTDVSTSNTLVGRIVDVPVDTEALVQMQQPGDTSL